MCTLDGFAPTHGRRKTIRFWQRDRRGSGISTSRHPHRASGGSSCRATAEAASASVSASLTARCIVRSASMKRLFSPRAPASCIARACMSSLVGFEPGLGWNSFGLKVDQAFMTRVGPTSGTESQPGDIMGHNCRRSGHIWQTHRQCLGHRHTPLPTKPTRPQASHLSERTRDAQGIGTACLSGQHVVDQCCAQHLQTQWGSQFRRQFSREP